MSNEATTSTQAEGRINGQFPKGVSGNPSGMPKGTKQRATKIRDTFFQVFFDEFGDLEKPETLKKLKDFAQMHSIDFLRILAGLLPKDIAIEGEGFGKDRTLIIQFGQSGQPVTKQEIPVGDASRATESIPSV